MKKKFLYLLIFAIVFRIVVSFVVWHPDLNNHADWGIRFWEYGAKAFYPANVWSFTWPNQPPGTMYMFAGVRKLFEFVFGVFWWINIKIPPFPSGVISYFEYNLYPSLLKLPAILSDLGIAYLIYKFVLLLKPKSKSIKSIKKVAVAGALIWLLNPVVWYNSSVWGQYDSVINFFVLLSFYLLFKNKLIPSLLFFVLSLYTKASLAIFAPIYAIVALKKKYKPRDWVLGILSCLLLIFVLSYPFAKGNVFVWLFELYKDKVFTQQLHVITANAFNFWSVIAGIHERPDSLPFLGLTFQHWGYILFSVSYIPLLYLVYKKPEIKRVIWVLALSGFTSFMLLTNMHERYLYPLFPYFTIIAATGMISTKYYWTVSILHLLNLYNFWFTPKIMFLISFLSFSNRLTPRLLGVVMFFLFVVFYQEFLRQISKKH